MLQLIQSRTWVEIKLDYVKYNFNEIKKHTKSKVCCAIKANVYGYDFVAFAKLYEKLGANFFVFSNIGEVL